MHRHARGIRDKGELSWLVDQSSWGYTEVALLSIRDLLCRS